jgi:hypothetical protein
MPDEIVKNNGVDFLTHLLNHVILEQLALKDWLLPARSLAIKALACSF